MLGLFLTPLPPLQVCSLVVNGLVANPPSVLVGVHGDIHEPGSGGLFGNVYGWRFAGTFHSVRVASVCPWGPAHYGNAPLDDPADFVCAVLSAPPSTCQQLSVFGSRSQAMTKKKAWGCCVPNPTLHTLSP